MNKKTPPPIRVLLVDDHEMVREGITALLARRKDIEVVGQAANGKEALQQVAALGPDVVLMDIAMPVMDGLQATTEIAKAFPASRVLVLTQYDSREYVFPLLRAGAAGYILKRARANELVEAIRAVHNDGAFLPPPMIHAVVSGIAQAQSAENDSPLTEREREVVRMVAEGLSSREIAERLSISVKTVDTHRANIMEKLGVHNAAELIKYAIRKGMVKA